MAGEKLFHVGVKALITDDDGKVLIFQTNPEHMHGDHQVHADLPGGRISNGETAIQALHREVEEETGITGITEAEFLTAVVAGIEVTISDTEKVGLVLMVYRVKVPAGAEVKISDEHSDYSWVSVEEAAERLEFKFTKDFSERLLREFGRAA